MAIANMRMLDLMADLARKPLNMSCIRYFYDDRILNEAHVHDYVQVWYCSKGEYLHSIGGKSLIYGEGSFVIIPAGTVHTFMTFPGVECELHELIFRTNAFDLLPKTPARTAQFFCFLSSFEESVRRVFHFKGEEKRELEEIIFRLEELTKKSSPSDMHNAAHMLSKLWGLPPFSLADEDLRRAEKFMAERFLPFLSAIEFINNNFSQNIRQSDLLEVSLLPRNVFQTFFRAYIGTNVATYITRLRLGRANYFIGYSQYSFDYIADVCGFCNTQYMTARYKEFYGYTPYKPRMRYKRNIATLPEKKIGTSLAEKVLAEKERL